MKFRIISISKTVNAFGLRGIILLAQNGEALEVGKNQLDNSEFYIGSDIEVHGEKGTRFIPGTEIPKQLAKAPNGVVLEVYPELNPKCNTHLLDI